MQQHELERLIENVKKERDTFVRREVMVLLKIKKDECLKINESARAKHIQVIMDFFEKYDFLKSSRTQ